MWPGEKGGNPANVAALLLLLDFPLTASELPFAIRSLHRNPCLHIVPTPVEEEKA